MNIHYEKKNDPINVYIDKKLSPKPHLHKEVELIFVQSGSATAFADGESTFIKTGDIFVAFPNQVHYYENSEIGNYDILCISPKLFFGQKERLYSSAPVTNIAKITPEINSALYEFLKLPKEDVLSRAGYLCIIFSKIIACLKLTPNSRKDNGTIREVLDWCENHFSEELSLETVATANHLSRCYVSHLFTQKLGMGFSNYINILRINAACELLRESDKKISDIAGDVGYSTIRSFNRAFSKLKGVTPQHYRDLR